MLNDEREGKPKQAFQLIVVSQAIPRLKQQFPPWAFVVGDCEGRTCKMVFWTSLWQSHDDLTPISCSGDHCGCPKGFYMGNCCD